MTKTMNESYLYQKFGIFIHYAYGGEAYKVTLNADLSVPLSLDELADNFNAEKLAEDAAAFGVEYVIFTIWHANMNVLYPSERMLKWRTGVHTSKRDVINDLLEELNKKNIKLILYTHPSDGHDLSSEDQIAVGQNDPTGGYKIWNDFINDIYDELCYRYSGRVAGYWLDGGFPELVDQKRLRSTVLSRHPGAVLIANGFANECCDFGCKELNCPEYDLWLTEYPPAATDDVQTWWGYQRQIAVVSTTGGNWWASGSTQRYSAEHMFLYTVLSAAVNQEGGGVCWAASPFPGGAWEPGVKESFLALAKYIKPIEESIKNVMPSTSYNTKESTRLKDLIWGGVATKSVDERYEYIHVLNPPKGKTLHLPVPADGKIFSSAILLSNGHNIKLEQNNTGVHLELMGIDDWDSLNTVIKLESAISVSI